ncbi:MAG: carbohydrate kinase [Verrucomicrobium sp.]|nr:carbohydrate kinase [Verrucomicrobium sp.]
MKKILCFGELLWDCLPTGRHPGGAPVNVAYHLAQNGIEPFVATAVGEDELGREILAYLEGQGISTRFIVRHTDWPTGTVQATINEQGNASYDIKTGVAWDHIVPPAELKALAPSLDGIVFGSLAQRSPQNLAEILELLHVFQKDSSKLRIFDVNLRPPFDTVETVWKLAKEANVIKLNHEEAARLTGISLADGTLDTVAIRLARALEKETGCHTICITAAERGAGLLIKGEWYFERGRKVQVADTVGAGDSFLARLTRGLLSGTEHPRDTLAAACRTGEWVASQKGAMPSYAVFHAAQALAV